MNKQDWAVLIYSTLVSIIIFLLIYLNFSNDENIFLNIISIIGTLITIVALVFSIHQQIQIKKTSELIEENSKNYQDTIEVVLQLEYFTGNSIKRKIGSPLTKRREYSNFHLCAKRNSKYFVGLQKAVLVHYSNELENCLNCLEGKNVSKEQITDTIKKCKDKCEVLWSEQYTTSMLNYLLKILT